MKYSKIKSLLFLITFSCFQYHGINLYKMKCYCDPITSEIFYDVIPESSKPSNSETSPFRMDESFVEEAEEDETSVAYYYPFYEYRSFDQKAIENIPRVAVELETAEEAEVRTAKECLSRLFLSTNQIQYLDFQKLDNSIKDILQDISFIALNGNQLLPICSMIYRNPGLKKEEYRYIVFENSKRHFTLEEAIIMDIHKKNSVIINKRKNLIDKILEKYSFISLPLKELRRNHGEVYVVKDDPKNEKHRYYLVENMVSQYDFSKLYHRINEYVIDFQSRDIIRDNLLSSIRETKNCHISLALNVHGSKGDATEYSATIILKKDNDRLYLGTEKQVEWIAE